MSTQLSQNKRLQNLILAIEDYKVALMGERRNDALFPWAKTQNNLAVAYAQIVFENLDQEARGKYIELALSSFKKALTVFTLNVHPAEHRRIQTNVARLCLQEQRWSEGLRAARAAIEAGEILQDTAYTESGQRFEISETTEAYRSAAYCLIQEAKQEEELLGKAFQLLEASKTRLLNEALRLSEADLSSIDHKSRELFQEKRRSYVEALEEYRKSSKSNFPVPPQREIIANLEQAKQEYYACKVELRKEYPDFLPQALSLSEIISLVPVEGAIVAPLFTDHGSYIFVIPHGVEKITFNHLISLDNFTLNDLYTRVLIGNKNDPGWVTTLIEIVERGRNIDQWQAAVKKITEGPWHLILEKIFGRLKDHRVNQIIWMPQGGLQLLPMYLECYPQNGDTRYIVDDYEITYIPTAYTLSVAYRRKIELLNDKSLVLGVGNAGGLPFSREEAQVVAKILDTPALIEDDASRNTLIERSEGSNIIHLACHGSLGWSSSPREPALVMAHGEPVRIVDVFDEINFKSAQLVVLSACNTGLTILRQVPDEFIGLPMTIIQAGAASIVSTLWPVNDHSTFFLMARFYSNIMKREFSPAHALQEAQKWLRIQTWQGLWNFIKGFDREKYMALLKEKYEQKDEIPFSDPYYWAGFVYTGA